MTSLLLSPSRSGVAAARWLALRSVWPLRAADLAAVLAVAESRPDGALPGQWLLLADTRGSAIGGGHSQWVQLVWPAGAQPGKGRISVLSPLGRVLLGQQPGAVIRLRLPGVLCEFQLQELMSVRRKPQRFGPV